MRAVFADLLHYWRTRRRRAMWTPEMQREHLVQLLQADHRWMAGNPIVDALTERYMAALSEHWYQQSFEEVGALRRRLGLCPHERRREKERMMGGIL